MNIWRQHVLILSRFIYVSLVETTPREEELHSNDFHIIQKHLDEIVFR